VRGPAARDCAQDEQQDHRADERDQNAPPGEPVVPDVTELVEHPAADEGTDNADDEVTDDPARTLAGDNVLGEDPRDESDE